MMVFVDIYLIFFFFNDTATTEIYTLSLHDALPIPSCWTLARCSKTCCFRRRSEIWTSRSTGRGDRKSTRLNSSHDQISYAVFCLKKKTVDLIKTDQQQQALACLTADNKLLKICHTL